MAGLKQDASLSPKTLTLEHVEEFTEGSLGALHKQDFGSALLALPISWPTEWGLPEGLSQGWRDIVVAS